MMRLFDALLKFAVGIPFFYFLKYTLGDEGKKKKKSIERKKEKKKE